MSSKVLGKLILYLYNENYKKDELFKILDSFALHKKYHQRINFIKICKILLDNKNIYTEKIMELFFVIASYEKILNVKIALSKLIKKVILNENCECHREKSLLKLCEILMSRQKNITIENILRNVIIKEIDDKTNYIFNQFSLKFNGKNKIFVGDNKYFIKEFNIDYEEDKKPKNNEFGEYTISEDNKQREKNSLIDNKQINDLSENKKNDLSESAKNEDKKIISENSESINLNNVNNNNNINNIINDDFKNENES